MTGDARPQVSRPVIYSLVALTISFVLLAVATLIYTNMVARSEIRNLCAIIVTSDDAYRSNPPVSPIGKELAAEFADLRKKIC